MLNYLVRFSLKKRGLVLALAAMLLVVGAYTAAHSPLDVFPEFVQPQVDIQTEAPGLSPEQVELLITRPVETAVLGATGLESVRSESIQGLSIITAIFKEDANILTARQLLAEKLAETTRSLPAGTPPPTLSPLTSSTMDLLKVGLLSEKLTPLELRTFADFTLRPRLLAVPGVARVSTYGGDIAELQIQVHPDKLAALGLSLSDVLTAARSATGIRGAGFIETAAQRITLQSSGQPDTAAQLASTLILPATDGGPGVRLSDVATLLEAPAAPFGDALIQGKPGVLLALSSAYGANTLQVTEAVEAALAELKPTFTNAKIETYQRLHRPATFIENALSNVRRALLIGAALVALVLILFLLDLRTAFISFTAIPLSLLATVLIFHAFGVSLNTMTLGGFAVAIGMVVDDAIIDVENVLRRLRENAALPQPRLAWRVVLDASLEVRSAVVYATFIVALVFLPVLTLSGLQGRFFAPLGQAFILSCLASLLVALTVTPALCLVLLGKAKPHREPFYLTWLKSQHHAWLLILSRFPRLTLTLTFLLCAATLALIPLFSNELLPQFREGHFVIQANTAPGTSLPEMRRLGQKISAALLAHPSVATVEMQAGRAARGEDSWGPHRSELHVELKPGSAAEEATIQSELLAIMETFPGVQSEVLTFLGDRISETLSGETAPFVISLFGDDLDLLDANAARIAALLRTVPGATSVRLKSPPGAPLIDLELNLEAISRHGFRPTDVLEAIETAYQGTTTGEVMRGERPLPLTVLLDPAHRQDPEALGQLLLTNAAGTTLPLSALTHLTLGQGRDSIEHDGARRRTIITCIPTGTDPAAFAATVATQLATLKLPTGFYTQITGNAAAETAARRELGLHFALALVGMIMLLTLVFPRPRHILIVLANLPFALAGGLLAVFATGSLLSIGSLVGFVTLFGISMRNSIMMLSHLQHLVEKEHAPWSLDTVIRGASERLIPITMTALVTALGLLPLALGTGEAGSEIESPMAQVILGGLISSTLLNLLVLPTLAWHHAKLSPIPPVITASSLT